MDDSPNNNDSQNPNGMISWFARNGVAANLLMSSIILAGLFVLFRKSTVEVFPEIDLDIVNIQMQYRGATPEEVEKGVVVKIEEAIQDLIGMKEIISSAAEGIGTIRVEVSKGFDPREVLDDIKNRVDAINTFPMETERPVFSIEKRRREVISVVVAGIMPERELRQLGERVRDDLTILPEVTQVEMVEVRPYEVSIEISEKTLRKFGITFGTVTEAIRRSSIDLPAGAIKTQGGEILLRTKGQAYVQEDFEKIVAITREDGTHLTLGEIATIKDEFEEEPISASYNGEPCVMIDVYRVGDQSAIRISKAVKDYIESARATMPPGIKLTYWRDWAKIIRNRLDTLTKNGLQGFVLVLLVLTLFLRFKVAAWVCVGIPVSFLGAVALMPVFGVTVNIISLFAFILVLGIVVDDAIVTGENIYTHIQHGDQGTEAAITGTKEVAVPVTFGVLTTIAAFVPLLYMEGRFARFFAQIPLIVIPVMAFSLIESKLVLPSHLKHVKPVIDPNTLPWLLRLQRMVADGLLWCVDNWYRPVLSACLKWRYATASVFIGAFIIIIALVKSGAVGFTPFPRVESEVARAILTMPLGTPFEVTESHIRRINAAAKNLQEKYVDPYTGQKVIMNILATAGSAGHRRGHSNLGRVMFEIVPPEKRAPCISMKQLVGEWRKLIGPLAGARELSFRAEIGHSRDPINIQLSGNDSELLAKLADRIKTRLSEYPVAFGITDTFELGKEEIRLAIKPDAELLGLTMADLGRQVRYAFFGQEAQRIQRGREDVRVMVRYPKSERRSIGNLHNMMIRTADGVEVPFHSVANVRPGRSYSTIRRVDRKRTVNVKADVNKEEADMQAINAELEEFLTELVRTHPGVSFSMEGEAREQRDNMNSLVWGGIPLVLIIYALLAIPFKSYFQPLIVMSVIPFGLMGAVLGHMIMNMKISMLSVYGLLALIGVVVNDSLVMVDYVNQRRGDGATIVEAIRSAGVARFRAILLTSLTTFVGLMPLLFEKSTQAQFLIPMAVSLGFGVLFATFVTLVLVPINYLVLEDLHSAWRSFKRWYLMRN